ncbi:MAG: hypothetical protein ACRDNK_04290 [Solirubrobacteraceae bacterium]
MKSRIGIKDVYEQVTQLLGKVTTMQEQMTHATEVRADHEARIRLLERWRYALPASFVVSGSSIVVAIIEMFHR